MRNLLLISHSSALTGAPILLHDIASRLDKSKYGLRFVVGDLGPMVERFERIGSTQVEEIYPDELKYWREIKRARRRLRLLKSIRPDLIFCNTIHTAKWLVYARLLGIPTLTHVLELSQGFKSLTWIEHLMVKHFSNHFIAASEAVKKNLVENQGITPTKIDVAHAGVNVQRFGRPEGVQELRNRFGIGESLVVGTVGRITHVKGSDLFVRLAAKLKQTGKASPPLKFLVVATTADKEFYRKFCTLIEEHGLKKDFVVVQDVADTAPYFSAMDIYVSTAREDPFPLVVLEAMASRKPVAGFAVGGIPEAVTPECGVLTDSEEIETLASEISKLITDPERRKNLGEAARRRVEERFTLERYARDVKKVIEATMTG